jgi:hypothetical protein
MLEHASVEWRRALELEGADPCGVHGDDLTGLDVSHVGGADDIEGAGLRREDRRAVESSHGERAPAIRVAGCQQRVIDQYEQRIGTFDSLECFGELPFRLLGMSAGEAVDDDLGVHRGAENRTAAFKRLSQFGRVGQVPVVGQPDVATAELHQRRLRVLDRRRARGGISGVAKGGTAR